MLTLMVDTEFWACIIAAKYKHGPVVNVYTNGSVYTNGCYRAY